MERIEIRDMQPEDELYVGSCSSDNVERAKFRIEWLRNACDYKGLRVKVALLDGEHAGFIHVYPIETCPWGPLGQDLSAIMCIAVKNRFSGKGVGLTLMRAAEEDARAQRRKGIVVKAYYSDFWFMQAPFFEKCGYSRVCGPRDVPIKGMDNVLNDETLLWKVFEHNAKSPRFLERRYQYEPIPGKVVVDLFHTASCMTYLTERERVREVCSEFGDSIMLNEYDADDPEILRKYQIYRGIFINGKEIGWGNEAPKEGIYEAIEKEL